MRVILYTQQEQLKERVKNFCQKAGFVLEERTNVSQIMQVKGQRCLMIIDGRDLQIDVYHDTCLNLKQLKFPWILVSTRSEPMLAANKFGWVMPKLLPQIEFEKQIERVLQRFEPGKIREQMIEYPQFVMNAATYELFVNEKRVAVTAKEFQLLFLLAENSGRVFSRQELIHQLWDEHYSGGVRAVDHHVKRLRKKLAAADNEQYRIQTVYQYGYTFLPESQN